MRATTQDWYDRIPKVELHLHLEGAIPLPALWQLVQKYGGDPEAPTLAALEEKFRYRDFPHFLRTWLWKNRFLKEYEDFTFIAREVARDLAAQKILYAEAFISPPDFFRAGLTTQKIAEAVRAGLDQVPGTEIALVVDLVRNYGAGQGARTLEEAHEARGCGILGIGIGGSEHEYPPELFSAVYERARELGFFTSAHAGEAAGAASVWGAVRGLKADRIGHATRAGEDPRLVDHLAETRVPLEMCPLSNLRTAVVPSLRDHPIRAYFDRGCLVTVSTDDPKMFNNSLAEEFRALAGTHGFRRDEIKRLILNGIEASWLPAGRKQELRGRIEGDPAWSSES